MSHTGNLGDVFEQLEIDEEDAIAELPVPAQDAAPSDADSCDTQDDNEEEEVYVFECRGCQQSLAVGSECLGQEITCPTCNHTMALPGLPEPTDTEQAE